MIGCGKLCGKVLFCCGKACGKFVESCGKQKTSLGGRLVGVGPVSRPEIKPILDGSVLFYESVR